MKTILKPFKIVDIQNLARPIVIQKLPESIGEAAKHVETPANNYKAGFVVACLVAAGLLVTLIVQQRRIKYLMGALTADQEKSANKNTLQKS